MPVTAMELSEHPLLAHFQRAIERFQPPRGPFDPRGPWKSAYDMVECSGGMSRCGALHIEREPSGSGAILRVRLRKSAAGGMLRCRAEIECAADALAAPVSWKLESAAHDATDALIVDTRLAESGVVRDGAIEVRTGGGIRRTPAPGPLAFHWGLFDAVQRLPREKDTTHRFTLVDRLNAQVKPNQTLSFRESLTLSLGGRMVWEEKRQDLEAGTLYRPVAARQGAMPMRCHVFDQVGEGILPLTYWVDDAGRLLFVLSGLVGYVWNPEAQG